MTTSLSRARRMAIALTLLLCAAGCARARPRTAPLPDPSRAAPAPPPAATPPASAGDSVGTPAARAGMGDATLEYLRARELMVPVEGVSVAQVPHTFDERRGDRPHNAHDIMAPRGTPVLSADDGRIIRLSGNSLGGITVYATDPDERLVYYYAHLEKYAPGLTAGQKIRKGDLLGYVGSSGNADPRYPHLHFQVARMVDISRHWEGVPIDARPYFAEDGRKR